MSDGFTRVYWVHATTPLHVGAGRGTGFIDLPVMREVVTNWPFVPGSSVKGVLAEHHDAGEDRRVGDPLKRAAFGGQHDVSNAGSIVFADARLVCLPVRSFYGTFGWCTSPIALRRLARDLSAAGIETPRIPHLPGGASPLSALVPDAPQTTVASPDGKVLFEDLDFQAVPSPEAQQWGEMIAALALPAEWASVFIQRFTVISDDVFGFLGETATQVDARVKIDGATGTAEGQALWYEESLPAESLLAGLVHCTRVLGPKGPTADDLERVFCTQDVALQMGGKASIGRGRVRLVFSKKA